MSKAPPKSTEPVEKQVFTLVVQVGRSPGDGLPKKSTGAGLLCYTAARDEAEAVRETVAVLKAAEMAPLDVTGYGTLDERSRDGDIEDEERELMARALEQDAVVVAEVTPFYDAN